MASVQLGALLPRTTNFTLRSTVDAIQKYVTGYMYNHLPPLDTSLDLPGSHDAIWITKLNKSFALFPPDTDDINWGFSYHTMKECSGITIVPYKDIGVVRLNEDDTPVSGAVVSINKYAPEEQEELITVFFLLLAVYNEATDELYMDTIELGQSRFYPLDI